MVLKDKYYLPPQLGGSGTFHPLAANHPYEKHDENLRYYLLVTSGYHVSNFITHFYGPRKNDFIEMALHHIVALYLFGGAYLNNGWEGGSVIAFLHDIADVPLALCKVLGESHFQTAAGIGMILVVIPVWFYTRCIVLPWIIHAVWNWKPFDLWPPICKPVFCYLLSCMFMLHCFWLSIMIKVILRFLRDGKAEDIQSKDSKIVEDDDKKGK